VEIWDRPSRRRLTQLPVGGTAYQMGFTQGGLLLVGMNRRILVYDVNALLAEG
jgi:hypothetical protein